LCNLNVPGPVSSAEEDDDLTLAEDMEEVRIEGLLS
jgi:hypothetical protein